MIMQRQPIVSIPLQDDIQLHGILRLATAIYCRAQRDVRSSVGMERISAISFLANDPLAQSIAEASDCDHDGAVKFDHYLIERRYFIELNDPNDNGRRYLTDSCPMVIRGYIQPLRRGRRGISSVIIVEEPSEFAAWWKALPPDEWIALDDYHGKAGDISEREYARLLDRTPGVHRSHVSIAWRRAMGY